MPLYTESKKGESYSFVTIIVTNYHTLTSSQLMRALVFVTISMLT